jgi:hypothetical protein
VNATIILAPVWCPAKKMSVENLTNPELLAKLTIVLQEWPLYRKLQYSGATLAEPPNSLKLFCEKCQFETAWSLWDNENIVTTHMRGSVGIPKELYFVKKYMCRNCGGKVARFFFYWLRADAGGGVFYKVGQAPEPEERVPKTLEDKLSPADLKVYRNALRLRNFNLGIGAVTYMRRVVENRMNDMLEVLHETARIHNGPAEVLAKYEVMKKEKRFSEKIDYAGDLLPVSLRPAGHPNPMAILHELASDGLHARTDEECVDIFDACRQTFEYVFGKMRIETEEAKKFVDGIAILRERKAKATKIAESVEPEKLDSPDTI